MPSSPQAPPRFPRHDHARFRRVNHPLRCRAPNRGVTSRHNERDTGGNIMDRVPQPVLDKRGEPQMKRWSEQRWLIDNIIRANGIDWDQPRSLYISAPCGVEANA